MIRRDNLRVATTQDKGHGRLETRKIETLTRVPPWLDWPGAQQVCRITRTRTLHNKTSTETVFAITSLPRLKANAERLLALTRQHWTIENRLHFVRDVSFGEDACRVRSGHAPQILAALRNLSLGLLRRTRHRYVPDAFRYFIAQPLAALALVRPSCDAAGDF